MTNEKYKIREICGDWALDIPFPSSVITIYFNSLAKAELVRDILIHGDAHPNKAVPFKPFIYPPAHIDREAWTAEWIEENEWNLPKCSKCGCNSKDAQYKHKNNFCPKCGRAMTPEAWAELEKRLRG